MSKQMRRIRRREERLTEQSPDAVWMAATWKRRSKKPLPRWKLELLSLPDDSQNPVQAAVRHALVAGHRYGKSELTRLQLEKV